MASTRQGAPVPGAGIFAADSMAGITASLIFLGVGWSASTVAGSTLLTRSVAARNRPQVQGLSDALMNVAGAAGGASPARSWP
ncbi:hypothetical protein [Pseudarthrobacter sp. NPDC057230]|uniref:hypothetical protein n=1 Tax=Pseudarthrobacter sp. NPDC057230 TaxID=3346057 RepID=UPI00363FAF28